MKQTGSAANNTGLSFFTGATTVGTDLVQERAVLNHEGDLAWVSIGRGPVIRSPDGTRYRITVANGGALSTTVVT